MSKEINSFSDLMKTEGTKIDWEWFYKNGYKMNEDFLAAHLHDLPMDVICRHQKLSLKFIKRNLNAFDDWYTLVVTQDLTEKCIERISERLLEKGFSTGGDYDEYENFWKTISVNQKLSTSFIEKHENDVNWFLITIGQSLKDESFLLKYADRISWENINDEMIIPYRIINERYKSMKPGKLFRLRMFDDHMFEKLSKEASEYFFGVSDHPKDVPEDDNIYIESWYTLLTYNTFSLEFFDKYWDYIVQDDIIKRALIRYNELSEEFMERHWKDLSSFYSYKELSAHQSFSYDFIKNHKDDLDLDCFGWHSFKDGKIPHGLTIEY